MDTCASAPRRRQRESRPSRGFKGLYGDPVKVSGRGHSGDPHLNPFYSYGGGSLENSAEAAVLEDNFTRALAVTVELTGTMGGPLFHFLVSRNRSPSRVALGVHLAERPIVDLQSGVSRDMLGRMDECNTRLVLGISPRGLVPSRSIAGETIPDQIGSIIDNVADQSRGELKTKILGLVDDLSEVEAPSDATRQDVATRLGDLLGFEGKEENYSWVSPEALSYLADSLGGSRPDAWLIFPQSKVGVVLESKLRTELYEAQLRRHARDSLGMPEAPWVICRWKDVYDFANRQKAKLPRLLGDYLEAIGVAGFTGVKEGLDENQSARVVRALMEDALPSVSSHFRGKGLDVSMEKRRTGSWLVYYVPGQRFNENVHLTVVLHDSGRLDFGLKIPNAATRGTRAKFQRLLRTRREFVSILAAIRQQVPELWITVRHRHMRGKRWIYDMIPDAMLEFDVDVVLEHVAAPPHMKFFPQYLEMLEQMETGPFNKEITVEARYHVNPEDNRRSYVEVDLGRRYRREPSNPDFVDEVVDLVKAFWPLFDALYSPP